jgi:hypothetical protein
VGVVGRTMSRSLTMLKGEIDRTGLAFLRFAMLASVIALFSRQGTVVFAGATVTLDQLLTCFGMSDRSGMAAVVRNPVWWRDKLKVEAEVDDRFGWKVEAVGVVGEAAVEEMVMDEEDGMGEEMVTGVEGGGFGLLEYLNDLGVIMLPVQEWAPAPNTGAWRGRVR